MTEKIKDQGTIKHQPRKEEDVEHAGEAQDAAARKNTSAWTTKYITVSQKHATTNLEWKQR